MTGKTIIEQGDFIYQFEKNHTLDEVSFLLNEIEARKQDNIFFTNAFFGLSIPMYTAIFSFVSVIVAAAFGFLNMLASNLISLEIEEKTFNPNHMTSIFGGAFSEVMLKIGIELLLAFALLLMMLYVRQLLISRQAKYVAWLLTVKEIKENQSTELKRDKQSQTVFSM